MGDHNTEIVNCLIGIEEDIATLLEKKPYNEKKHIILLTKYNNKLTELALETRIRENLKMPYREFKKVYKELSTDYEKRQKARELEQLFEGVKKPAAADQKTPDDLMKYGMKLQEDDNTRLKNIARTVEDAKEIGIITNQKLADQTDVIVKIDDDLNQIETTLERTAKVIKRIARRLLTDKCIWALVLMLVVGIIMLILFKTGMIKTR
jgi:methyl-accepting chemotaxis protein